MEHPLGFAVLTFLALMIVMTWAAYRLFYKPSRFLKQLGNPVIGNDRRHGIDVDVEPEASTIVTVLHQIGAHVPSSETETADLRTQLHGGERLLGGGIDGLDRHETYSEASLPRAEVGGREAGESSN